MVAAKTSAKGTLALRTRGEQGVPMNRLLMQKGLWPTLRGPEQRQRPSGGRCARVMVIMVEQERSPEAPASSLERTTGWRDGGYPG